MKRTVAAGIAVLGLALAIPQAADAAVPQAHRATYTIAQVGTHHTPDDCWSVVGSGVYNLTRWIKKHPGGPSVIEAMCGENATTAFMSQHGSASGNSRGGRDEDRAQRGDKSWSGERDDDEGSEGNDAERGDGNGGALKALARYRIGTLSGSGTQTTLIPATPTPTKTYALTEIAGHNTIGSCWTVLSTNVYDLTKFIPRHPGGSGVIAPACGTDGTKIFQGRHGTGPAYPAKLAPFMIGKVA